MLLWRYNVSEIINVQVHVIKRIDDTAMQILIDHLSIHDLFPNCLIQAAYGGAMNCSAGNFL
jgi:hypothetical protein